jgi:iron-sulfur cluster assembly protein
VLNLTDRAQSSIRQILVQNDLPDSAGLRIVNEPAAGGDEQLGLTLAALPAEDDAVVEEGGARVFLDQGAAVLLDDKTLDAGADAEGMVQFALTPQAV